MKTATFKDWTLTALDKAFGLRQIWTCALMAAWENQAAQVLAAMLAAREKNPHHTPVYGVFVIDLVWNFVILNGDEYCISKTYHADDEEIFVISNYLRP